MKTREKKKREKKKWQERCRLHTKKRLEDTLSAIGLLHEFRKLPPDMRRVVLEAIPARPQVIIEPPAAQHAHPRWVKGWIEQGLEQVSVEGIGKQRVLLSEFFSTCRVLPFLFTGLGKAPWPRKFQPLTAELAERASKFTEDQLDPAIDLLIRRVHAGQFASSRVDSGVCGCRLEMPKYHPGGPLFRLWVCHKPPQEIQVTIDGKVRPAFPCHLPYYLRGIRHAEGGAGFDLPVHRTYPIYIQTHALRRLRERLPLGAMLESLIHEGLVESLLEPRVVERQASGRYMIEYRLRGHHIGYLVGRVVEDKIVIVTLLLLPMQGTPESRQLAAKLRLTRPDIEYQGLDRLGTYLDPTLRTDDVLAGLLERCGCGPLLELARREFPDRPASNHATELRRYLRITAADESVPRLVV